MKFFRLSRIKAAIEHLSKFDSKWVIVPLVFAVNNVNDDEPVDPNDGRHAGTSAFLDKYFSGKLIGLPPLGRGALRPRFTDVVTPVGAEVSYQKVNLWGSGYSSRGYREMAARGQLNLTDQRYQTTTEFWPAWAAALPESFCFEELLVWLFAFSGIPQGIDSWASLAAHFESDCMGDAGQMGDRWKVRFHTNHEVAWPEEFLKDRPSNAEFQAALMRVDASGPTPTMAGDLVGLGAAIGRAQAALHAGKHVVLIGPPGTGKTTLAEWLCEANQQPHALTTATAEWTSTDTIGGYFPQLNDSGGAPIDFQPGVVSQALLDGRWIVIDELNRADMDKAFGELFTFLSGSQAIRIRLPYFKQVDGHAHPVVLGQGDAGSEDFHISRDPGWRMIGTMNTFDKASLYQLSYAFMRRFAFVNVEPPPPDQYAELIKSASAALLPVSPTGELPEAGTLPIPVPSTEVDLGETAGTTSSESLGDPQQEVAELLVELFAAPAQDGLALIGLRVGPAIPLDILRYVAQREVDAPNLTPATLVLEGLEMYFYPQLEGREQQHEGFIELIGQTLQLSSLDLAATSASLAVWTGYSSGADNPDG